MACIDTPDGLRVWLRLTGDLRIHPVDGGDGVRFSGWRPWRRDVAARGALRHGVRLQQPLRPRPGGGAREAGSPGVFDTVRKRRVVF